MSLFEQLSIHNRIIENDSPKDMRIIMEKPDINLAALRDKSINYLKKFKVI